MRALYSKKEMEELLFQCGFCIREHLDHVSMTEQYFSEYNKNSPEHPMAAPAGVSYVLAVRE